MLLNPDLANSAILVFANKSDLPSARDAGDLIETYGLEDVRSHEIRVQTCSAVTGVGLQEGLDWLATMIQNRVPNKRMGQAVHRLDENSN